MAKRKTHAHRTVGETGEATCECGKEFGSDDLWRAHYEEMHDEDERATLEGRDPSGDETAEREFEERHAAVVAARDEALAAQDADAD